VRVIAGSAKGVRLAPVPGGVRPVSDRAREGLFSSLGPDVPGARVLDLFAGTGALGIEALSRGAESAVFVDRQPGAVAAIRRNLSALGLEGAAVHRRDAVAFLDAAGETYDLIFVDPPYDCALRLAGPLSRALMPVLSSDALIVSESDKRTPLELELPLVRERAYGDTRIAVHRGG
jgi:16S rRNA (guanine966-N2)-methyltransferase